MNIKTLEEKIADKAHAEVQSAIQALCRSMAQAVNAFVADSGSCSASETYGDFALSPVGRKVIENLLADPKHQRGGWPKEAWTNREQVIRNDIMEKMDILQRTLAAPARAEGDATPAGDPNE